MTAADEVDEEERHVPTSGGNNASGSSTAVDASQGAGAAASTMLCEPATTFPRGRDASREVTAGNAIPIILLRLEIRVRQDDLQRGAMIKAHTVDVDPRDVLPNHDFGEMKIPEVACLTM